MRHSTVVLLAALLTACAGATPGEGHACTEIGCADGLFVHITPAAPWPPGEYRFVVETDGVTTTCTGSLPLPPCETRAITCDREGVVAIGESGCALPPSAHGLGDLTLPSTPEQITVEVQHEGRTLARETFAPRYQTSQPNGPGCPPICTNASVDLALDFE